MLIRIIIVNFIVWICAIYVPTDKQPMEIFEKIQSRYKVNIKLHLKFHFLSKKNYSIRFKEKLRLQYKFEKTSKKIFRLYSKKVITNIQIFAHKFLRNSKKHFLLNILAYEDIVSGLNILGIAGVTLQRTYEEKRNKFLQAVLFETNKLLYMIKSNLEIEYKILFSDFIQAFEHRKLIKIKIHKNDYLDRIFFDYCDLLTYFCSILKIEMERIVLTHEKDLLMVHSDYKALDFITNLHYNIHILLEEYAEKTYTALENQQPTIEVLLNVLKIDMINYTG